MADEQEAVHEGNLVWAVGEINRLRVQVRRLENDLEIARMQQSEERREEARQQRIDEMARRIWAEDSFRRDDEYTSPYNLARIAYRQAAVLEEAREGFLKERAAARQQAKEAR